jgi:hypothetical protein
VICFVSGYLGVFGALDMKKNTLPLENEKLEFEKFKKVCEGLSLPGILQDEDA